MQIRWTREALADYQNILEQAQERDRLEAANIAWRVQRAERNIETFPKAALHNQARNYYERYVPRTRVILIYTITETEIVMIAAFHTSRRVGDKP